MMIRKWLAVIIASIMVAVGAWQTGSAAYIHAKAILAQVLLEQAWQETRTGHREVRPWPWADTWPVARLEVPRLGESAIVLAGTGGEALAFGPGHVGTSAAPGRSGTTIFSAHRDTHFRFLKNIKRDDAIIVTTPVGDRHVYRVSGMFVVDATHFRMSPDHSHARLLLTTCYPFDAITPGGSGRYVVMAEIESGTLI